ncbi:PaaI family thioesterase [Rothia amarae]|uniref:PaaI family thioesterase n=1 Tax=Rothia amarae TaxID=169480 RepID=A0A7H2BJ67_9MICC|nr:PaaI family thioesterase [Rothia amarae]QNV39713.1 PaaI family thioesterase [Rothia amarae]
MNEAQESSTQRELWKITLGELDEKLGVKVLEESATRVVATMPVAGNRQSLGLLHGGAMLALGEAVGSWGAVIHASSMGKLAVGVDVNATHHKSSKDGSVTATSSAIHLGRSLTTHEVVITHNDDGARLCTMRITNFIK